MSAARVPQEPPPDGLTMVNALLGHVRTILVDPSHPGNVGSSARALKTMGLSRLAIVTPRRADLRTAAEAVALAAGAADVLDAASSHDTLDGALAGAQFAIAVTARKRELSPPEMSPAAVANLALGMAARGEEIALVFGGEQHGLANEDVMKCHATCTIATDPNCKSLNLAQAVQVLAYEFRNAALARDATTPAAPGYARRADHAEREQMFAHLEQALTTLGYFDPDNPGRLMPRLREISVRADLRSDDINIVRGICRAILEHGP